MAITVTSVKQRRQFKYSIDKPNGTSLYYVMFSTDTPAEYADYGAKLAMCLSAVDPDAAPANITNSIPQFASQLTSNDGVTALFPTYVRNVTPNIHRGQNNWWEVRVQYREPDTNTVSGTPDNPDILDDDPENLTVDYDWDTAPIKMKIWQDFTPVAEGGPLAILNSSNDPFSQLPSVDRYLTTCVIRRKTTDYDPLDVSEVVGKINSVAMLINGKGPFAVGTVLLKRWAGKERSAVVQKSGEAQSAINYDDEIIQLVINPDTWIGKIFDQGLQEWFPAGAPGGISSNSKVPIRKNGEKVRTPQALNGRGEAAYDDKGVKRNNIVAVPAPIAGLPGVEIIGAQLGAMLLFNFYKSTDLDADLGGI